jgi:hypothetical protein
MNNPKKTKKLKKCPIDDCWEMISIKKYLCSACTSWWHRIQIKNTQEFSLYLRRLDRFAGRAHRLHSNKRKVA